MKVLVCGGRHFRSPAQVFGPLELSSRERVLRRDGVMLPLGGRAFDILIYLAGPSGEVIAKQELLDRVWLDVTVVTSRGRSLPWRNASI